MNYDIDHIGDYCCIQEQTDRVLLRITNLEFGFVGSFFFVDNVMQYLSNAELIEDDDAEGNHLAGDNDLDFGVRLNLAVKLLAVGLVNLYGQVQRDEIHKEKTANFKDDCFD